MRKLVVLLAVGALGLAGCGGDDSDSADGDGSSTTRGSNGSVTTGSLPGGDSEFGRLLARTATATYKVTYESGEEGDDSETFTLAQDPPRFAYVTPDVATYVTAEGTAISCTGSGSAAQCTQLPGSGDVYKTGLNSAYGGAAALFLSVAGAAIPGLANIETADETIAGRDAACATIDADLMASLGGENIESSYSVCVDKETGVMLRVVSDDGNGSADNLTATEFGEPSDDDFTPPATPVTIPGLTPPS